MKAALIAGAFGLAAFAGLFVYMRTQSANSDYSDSVPFVAELPAKTPPSTREEPRTPPARRPASTRNLPNTQAQGPSPWTPPPKPKTMYYTVVSRDRSPIPDRIIIHGTSLGQVTILLDGDNATGQLYIRRSTITRGKEQHPWEVRIVNRELTVYWDGEEVPPR
jgi:hypothetical protein